MRKKKQCFRRFFAMLLSLVMCVSSVQLQPLDVQAEESTTYYKVVEANELAISDKIIIVADNNAFALSTEQKTSNRGQAEVTKSEDGKTVIPGADVQIITLEEGTEEGTFAFNVGSGYLYAASKSSNHLKTTNDKDANGSWKIEIKEGIASVVAQGENTRNILRYNATSSLFSCYGSGQEDIVIYKATELNKCHTNKIKQKVFVAGS